SAVRGSILYVGWFWLGLLAAVALLSSYVTEDKKPRAILLMVSLSGLMYITPYFFVAPASDFRYLYWASIAGALVASIFIALILRTFIRVITRIFWSKFSK
ncbi:MAG TPA: hypothetical protein PLV25_06745, partial [Opitutales bacterium]|nr:hypothetical protein [Opitutales bacterium]